MGLIDISGIVNKVIDAVSSHFPKPEDKLKLKELEAQIQTMLVSNLSAIDQAQAAINLEEAKSQSFFKSGWRPYVAWLCAGGLTFTIIRVLIEWVSIIISKPISLPNIDTTTLIGLLVPLLGLSTQRMVERINDKV